MILRERPWIPWGVFSILLKKIKRVEDNPPYLRILFEAEETRVLPKPGLLSERTTKGS